MLRNVDPGHGRSAGVRKRQRGQDPHRARGVPERLTPA
jgi:hypothetical protein